MHQGPGGGSAEVENKVTVTPAQRIHQSLNEPISSVPQHGVRIPNPRVDQLAG